MGERKDYRIAKPISLYIDCFGTEKIDLDRIYEIVENNFDFSVGNIIRELDLLRPIYKQTACYGHFGRKEFPWENIKELDYEKQAQFGHFTSEDLG